MQGGVELVDAEPGERLAGIVARIAGFRETARRPTRFQEAASLVVPLVISFGDPFRIGLGRDPTPDDRFDSFAAGLFAGPVVIESAGAAHCIQVDFTPLGARRFFRCPMHELADRMVALEDVLGTEGSRLRQQLGEETAWPARFDLVRAFIERRVAVTDLPAPAIRLAFDGIRRSGGQVRMARLAERAGWSRKHLVARFRDEIGLGPKAIARIVRINRAVGMIRSGGDGLAAIAQDCGFADQAHLSREVQALAGLTPAQLRG